LFQDGQQKVNDHSDPDLGLNRVGGRTVKGLDPEVLFNPLEEQLDFPPSFEKGRNDFGGQSEVVGQKDQGAFLDFVSETGSSRKFVPDIFGSHPTSSYLVG